MAASAQKSETRLDESRPSAAAPRPAQLAVTYEDKSFWITKSAGNDDTEQIRMRIREIRASEQIFCLTIAGRDDRRGQRQTILRRTAIALLRMPAILRVWFARAR